MKRVLLLVVLSIFVNILFAQKQSTINYRGNMNDWGVTAMSKVDLPTGNSNFVIDILSDGDDAGSIFKFDNDGSWGHSWGRGDVFGVNTSTIWYSSGGNGSFNEQNGKTYVFTFRDISTDDDTDGYVFELSSSSVTISSCTESNTLSVWPGQSTTISTSLSGSKPTEQKVWLRYSANSDYSSSELVTMTLVSGNDYSATIPASFNSGGKTVYYYILSTGDISVNDGSADGATINFYKPTTNSYTVESAYTTKSSALTWSSVSSWDAGILPLTNQPVTIEDNLTLDQNVTVSNLTINNGVTFTASDDTKLNQTLTIADGGTLTNNGGIFTAAEGIVEFVGVGAVSGTISFNDVNLLGGVNFGGLSTIEGVLNMNTGGFISSNPPIYGSNSTLKYLIDYNRHLEWSATTDAGYPNHVIISNNSTLDLGNGGTGVVRQCAGDLTIESGSILTLNTNPMSAALTVKGDVINSGTIVLSSISGGDLKVEGDFTDNGTLTHNDRAVFFNGTTDQLINGTSTTVFGYLLVSADATVTIPSDKKVTIAKDLTVSDGSKGVGNLTLESGVSGTASLISNGSVSGVVNVEQSIAAYAKGTPGWHFLSSPVASQPINAFHNPESNDDFYYYDESQGMWINRTDDDGTSLNPIFETTFTVGKGYLVGFETTGTKLFSGTLNTALKESSLSYAYAGIDVDLKGWNLIGNQFPASIDWDEITRSASVDNAVYVINGADGEYLPYVDGIGALTDGIIPAMQGFFVHATALSQTVTVDPEDRTHNGAAFHKSENVSSDVMKVIVSDDSESSNLYLRFKYEATSSFDPSFDAYKLFGYSNIPQVFAYDENDKYSINSLPTNPEVQEVKLAVKTPITGEYTFSFSDVDMISNYSNIELQDKLLGTTILVNNNTQYSFTSEEGNNEGRFVLHFGATGINELAKENLQAYISGQNLYILGESGQAQLEVFDIQGKQLVSEQIVLDENYKKALSLPSGIYVVRVQNSTFLKSNKVIIK